MTESINKIKPVIYVIDPDQKLRSGLVALLDRSGFEPVGYSNAEEFLAAEKDSARSGCIVSEMKLPGANGLELLNTLRDNNSRLPLIILTSDPDVRHAVTALHKKAADYLVKPVIERELIKRINIALRKSKDTHGLAKNGQSG